MSDLVLVTGVNGFIASHVTVGLLEAGYHVRGTTRSKDKSYEILAKFATNGVDISNLEMIELDLEDDAGWKAAVADCRFVQHIASPFPLEPPIDREALVPGARGGSMRVVEQALGAGVERIVMTSTVMAMMGRPNRGPRVTLRETDWSDLDWKGLKAYPVSKTRAELAVWNYVKSQNMSERLTTICSGTVLGPDTYQNAPASFAIISSLLKGQMPMAPRLAYPIIDIRDSTAHHIQAMTAAGAGGRRLISASDTLWFLQIADVLREAYKSRRLPKRNAPDFVVRTAGIFDPRVRVTLTDLGVFHDVDAAYVATLTGVLPRPAREAVLAAAHSLIENGDVT